MKRIVISFFIIQVLIFLIILLRGDSISLLSYINNSFVYGGILVFLGLWVFIIRTGVFDLFATSMQKVFKKKSTLEDEVRSPSELMAFSSSPLLIIGGATLLLMGICLLIYEIF